MADIAHSPERRAFPRQKVAVAVYIERGVSDPLPCKAIDLSPNSVRIDAEGLSLPNTFIIMLKLGTNIRRHCRVVWRNGYVAGLQFTTWPVGLR